VVKTERGQGTAPLEVVVRSGAELDAAELTELFRVGWPEHGAPLFDLDRSLSWASAHAGQRLVGFVNVASDGGEHAFLLDTIVHPEFRRRGIGRALVRCAAEDARELGARHLHVDFEARHLEFYRRCGFGVTTAGLMALAPAAPDANKAEPSDASDAGGSPERSVVAAAGARVDPGARKLLLRRFSAEDRAACQAVFESVPEWFGVASAVNAYLDDLPRLPTWVASLADDPRVVGFLSLARSQPRAFEVHVLAVARDQHGHGVGRALMELGERFARHVGATLLLVKTLGPSHPDSFYERTRGFYTRLGYEPLLESEKLWGEGNPALLLVKSLA
jgi:ribosomal protein S18 acetylase RimI-like enzyme